MTEPPRKHLLNRSRTTLLRNSMRDFIEEHVTESDLKKLRQKTEGKAMSEMVDEGRKE